MSVCHQEMFRQYTDLTRQHDAEVVARHKQQQSHFETLHSATTPADGETADTTTQRLARMVRYDLLSLSFSLIYHASFDSCMAGLGVK